VPVPKVHHSAICTNHIDASLTFWRDGLGFTMLMDHPFEGDWPTLFNAPSDQLRSVFLGDPDDPDAGVVELVEFSSQVDGPAIVDEPARGFFLLSVFTDLDATRGRLASAGYTPLREITVSGVRMAVVRDPNGVLVELIDRDRMP
jgi:glyoxylase I family protein